MKTRLAKLDAATLLLDTAIELWFREADAVSTHVLACSAHQLIHDVNRSRGGERLLFDSDIIRDEFRRDAVAWLKQSYNFFKHADRDPEAEIEFNPSQTQFFLFAASRGLEGLGINPAPIRGAFNLYFALSNQRYIGLKGRKVLLDGLDVEIVRNAKAGNRREFLDSFIRRGF